MQFGISLSHHQLKALKIGLTFALNESLKPKFAYIRLSLYWNEIEKNQQVYDFSLIKKMLNFYQKNQQNIILTVGLKAQRWPEYYWPEFVKNKNLDNDETKKLLLKFIETSIKELKKYSCIKYWQLENEPLDPSGLHREIIPFDFLQQEALCIKKIDNRPMIISLWGNGIIKRNFVKNIYSITNNIGLDLYEKQFVKEILGKSIYLGPLQTKNTINKYRKEFPEINFWITELQAEPWEKNTIAYFSSAPQSMSIQQLIKNYNFALGLGIKNILFWGFEYWLWKKINGDNSYFKLVNKMTIDSHN